VDEAAHVDRDTFYRTVLPVASMYGTALILISSPVDSDNWYSRWMSFTDNSGETLFPVYSFQGACAECRRLNGREMLKCTHQRGSVPRHKDQSKVVKYGKAYEQEGIMEQNLQENHGIITRSATCAFRKDEVERVFDPTSRVTTAHNSIGYMIKEISICIDPNGGGVNETAIIIGYLNQHTKKTVVGNKNFTFFSQQHWIPLQPLNLSTSHSHAC